MKKCVVVLGMHRSGTSALSGVLHYLGVNMGSDLMPPSDENPKGFFENKKIYELNEKILHENKLSWDNVEIDFDVLESDKFSSYLRDAKRIITEQFKYNKVFAIKDPRNSILFPLWKKALESLGIDVSVIISYRNPLDVVASLKRRNGFSSEKGILLWAKHILCAELHSRSVKRIAVAYDDLLFERKKTIETICDALSVELTERKIITIDSFLDVNLRHHEHTADDVSDALPSYLFKLLDLQKVSSLDDVAAYDCIRKELINDIGIYHATDVVDGLPHVRALYKELDDKISRIIDLQNEVEEKNKWALRLNDELGKGAAVVVELQGKLDKLASEYRELSENEVAKKNQRIVALQEEVAKKNQHIVALQEELAKKNQRIVALQEDVEERNKWAFGLNEELDVAREINVEMKGAMTSLRATISQLENTVLERERVIDEERAGRNVMVEQLSDAQRVITEQAEVIQSERELAIINEAKLMGLKSMVASVDMKSTNIETYYYLKDKYHLRLVRKIAELVSSKRNILKLAGEIRFLLATNNALRNKIERVPRGFIEIFDAGKYLEANDDVRNAIDSGDFINAMEHFVMFGYDEVMGGGRLLYPGVDYFNETAYLSKHSDVRLAVENGEFASGYHHFLLHGAGEIRSRIRYDGVEIQEGYKLALINPDDVNFSEQRKIDVPVCQHPLVSIIIPAYNQANYTYACIESIVQNSGDVPYEIVVMDDNSPDELARQLDRYINNITFISNKDNLGFLLNCKKGATVAQGKYLLFLNNDTNVQPGWLMPLVELISSSESIGMVGSRLVYPDGRQQEAGGIIWNDASGWNFGRLDDPTKPEFNYVKEVDYISGASIMIERKLWDEIGGFDERYVPAYFEDSDLAFEVRRHGYKVMYQPRSIVVHFEGVSHGLDTSKGIKSYQVKNLELFKEKWREELLEGQFPNAENVFLARDRSSNKPAILFIDHYVPHFDQDAGSRTVYGYIKLFVSEGFNVKFIGDNYYPHQPYTTMLEALGVEVLYGNWYANNWETWLADNGKFFSYVFLNRPHISEKYIDAIGVHTKAKIIYYGHDLHFLREEREYQLTHDESKLESINKWRNVELGLMRKSDVALYPSFVEVEEIHKLDPSIKANAIPAYLFESFEDKDREVAATRDIMFVGGFGHAPNVDAVLWFVANVWDSIKRVIPDIKLYIIGSKPTDQILSLACSDIVVTGFVSDEVLDSYYDKCRIAVVPLRYGAGIKGKLVEALYHQIPIVTTSVGAEGLLDAMDYMVVADSAEDFASSVASLYADDNKLSQFSTNGMAYCEKYFSYEAAKKSLENQVSWRGNDIQE